MPSPTSNDRSDRSGPYPVFSFPHVLTVVFGHPQLMLSLAQASWRRACLRIAVLAFGAGVMMAVANVPEVVKRAHAWSDWFAAEVGSISISDGRLQWGSPSELPATRHFKRWRVDFREAAAEFDPGKRLGPSTHGLWISPDEVYIWWRLAEAERSTVFTLLHDGRFLDAVPAERLWPEGLQLAGPEFRDETNSALWQAVPLFIIMQGTATVAQVFFYVLLFSIIPYVMRSPLAAGGFGSVFAFYLYACIPPLAVATVYTLAGIPFLDFTTIFVGGLILYLLLVLWRTGRALQQGP